MQTTGKKVITRVLGLTYAPCMDTYTIPAKNLVRQSPLNCNPDDNFYPNPASREQGSKVQSDYICLCCGRKLVLSSRVQGKI